MYIHVKNNYTDKIGRGLKLLECVHIILMTYSYSRLNLSVNEEKSRSSIVDTAFIVSFSHDQIL